MAGQRHLVELALPVLLARQIAAGAQPPKACPGPRSGVAQRVLVLPAQPGGDADTGGGQLLLVAAEGEAVDVDDAVVRARADIGVGGEGEAEAHRPALARPYLPKKPVNVERDPGGRAAGQHLLEMTPRQPVPTPEEEGAGKLQADAKEPGTRDQHGVEDADGLVQQRVPRVVGKAGFLGRPDRRETDQERDIGICPAAFGQRAEHAQRLVEPAGPDQFPRLGRSGGRRGGDGLGAGGGCGEQQAGHDRKRMAEGKFHRLCS